MSFFESLGQNFVNLLEELQGAFLNQSLFWWLPADIQAVIAAVCVVLLILAIKRAVVA